jgi:hypothetical protein
MSVTRGGSPCSIAVRSAHSAADCRRSSVMSFGRTRPLREGTLREHSCGHARPLAVSRRRSFSGVCGWFVSVDSLACPRFPPPCSMVRRGSTVRVRQRASRKPLQMGICCCLPRRNVRASRVRDGYILGLAGTRGHARRLAAQPESCSRHSIASTHPKTSCKAEVGVACSDATLTPFFAKRVSRSSALPWPANYAPVANAAVAAGVLEFRLSQVQAGCKRCGSTFDPVRPSPASA